MRERFGVVSRNSMNSFATLYGFNAYWAVCKVERRAANRVKSLLGISIMDYDVVLKGNYLVHFYNSHFGSQERRAAHRPIHIDDIRQLPVVINSFTNISYGNRDNTLLFERNYPGCRFQLVVEVDHQRKRLSGISFRVLT